MSPATRRSNQLCTTNRRKFPFFLSPSLLVLLTPLGSASKSPVQGLNGGRFLFLPQGICEFLGTQRRSEREAPRTDPRAVPPAAKRRRPACQAGTENPGAGSGSHTEGRAWLKGGAWLNARLLAGYSIQPQPLRRQGCWPPYTDEKLRLRLNVATQLVSSTFGIHYRSASTYPLSDP